MIGVGGGIETRRNDGYFIGGSCPEVFADTVHHATLFHEAGADCIFVPGIKDPETRASAQLLMCLCI